MVLIFVGKIKKDRDKRKFIRKSSLKEHFPIKTIRKQKKLPDIVPSFLDSEFTNEKTRDERYDYFKYSLKDMINPRSNPKGKFFFIRSRRNPSDF